MKDCPLEPVPADHHLDKSTLELVPYDREFLELSWSWLNNLELKNLTMTPDFTREAQENFFASLPDRKGYEIFGVLINNTRAGACGLKSNDGQRAELWCYIALKEYWGRGLGQVLIRRLIDRAREMKLREIFVRVSPKNERARHAYEKSDFKLSSVHEHHIQMVYAL
jgi:RimJ/RimL family protein N-acetyltransferase